MNTSHIFAIVVCALGVGYFIGQENSAPAIQYPEFSTRSENFTTTNTETVTVKPIEGNEYQDENIRRQLEDARNSAQATRDEAQSRAFEAKMDLMRTGKTDDILRMNEADSSATRAQETLNNIDDALRKTNH
jgi:hypothetical protein